jgi:hypothetical protein
LFSARDQFLNPLHILRGLAEAAFDMRQMTLSSDRYVNLTRLVGIARVDDAVIPRDYRVFTFHERVDALDETLKVLRSFFAHRSSVAIEGRADGGEFMTAPRCVFIW